MWPCEACGQLSGLSAAGMAHGPILNALSNPTVSLGLGTVALLGPGRPLIKDGIMSLIRQAAVMQPTSTSPDILIWLC